MKETQSYPPPQPDELSWRAPGAAYELILWLLLLKGHFDDEGLAGLELKQVEFHISFYWPFSESKTVLTNSKTFCNIPKKMAWLITCIKCRDTNDLKPLKQSRAASGLYPLLVRLISIKMLILMLSFDTHLHTHTVHWHFCFALQAFNRPYLDRDGIAQRLTEAGILC